MIQVKAVPVDGTGYGQEEMYGNEDGSGGDFPSEDGNGRGSYGVKIGDGIGHGVPYLFAEPGWGGGDLASRLRYSNISGW
jgi:hypothetical protein